jgi:hypothetical protein
MPNWQGDENHAYRVILGKGHCSVLILPVAVIVQSLAVLLKKFAFCELIISRLGGAFAGDAQALISLSRQEIAREPQAFFAGQDFEHDPLKSFRDQVYFRPGEWLKQFDELVIVIIISELQHPSVF